MDRPKKPHGRGRGGRGDRQASSSETSAAPPPPATTPQGPELQGAWARRPGSSHQSDSEPTYPPPPSLGRTVRPVNPQVGTEGDRPGYERSEQQPPPAVVPVGGDGNGGASAPNVGRGAVRGRRIINVDSLMTRPSHKINCKSGTTGKRVSLQSNYFKISSAPDWCLYQYRVDFNVEEDRIAVRRALLRLHREKLGSFLFDGSLLYTSTRYPNATADDKMELFSKRESDDQLIKIEIYIVGELARGDYHYLSLYNLILRRGIEHLKLQLVGRNYFDPQAKVIIPRFQFELWPGYLTSIHQHDYGILMGVEITHKVMRHQTIMDIMNSVRARRSPSLQADCKKEIIGLTVLTDYNNQTYRIDDIVFTVNPQTTFDKKGTAISYMDYYNEKYGIQIRNPTQPLLASRSTVRDRRGGKDEIVYLIPELCRVTGLSDSMKNDYELMKSMGDHTRIAPRVRIEKLLAFNKRLSSEPNSALEFSQWQLRLDNNLVEVPGRVLPEEKILFGRQAVGRTGLKGDWRQEVRGKHMIVCAKLQQWFFIMPNKLSNESRNFVSALIKVGQDLGFEISQPSVIPLQDDSASSYVRALNEIMNKNNPQLVYCVCMRPRADVYSAIKKVCCVERPVPSQVMLAKVFRAKGMMSIVTKIAIQVNCKIGGAPWSLDFGISNIMVVGFDVCHDPAQRGTDFGAMVASLNRGFSRYYSSVSRHSTNEELSNHFGINIIKAVRKYHELNKVYPDRIVVYRDGVGDGQIAFVIEHEVKTIRKALAEFYGSPELVRLSFVIVTKRINTRFFLNGNNPPPGTVVDDGITNPNRYDFFIVAQHVDQGSVSPTAYNVIDDSSGLDVNTLQALSYKLTHMYFNCTSTLRVPAPCQYAHKLAFLISQSIRRLPSTHLDTLLYFL